MKPFHLSLSAVLATGALLLSSLAAGQALTHDYQILVDTDRDAATGCPVTPTGGAALDGFEHRLLATVEVTGSTATVVSLNRQDCSAASFGASQPVTSPASAPYSAALNAGLSGADALELAVLRSEISALLSTGVRLVFVADDGSGSDVLATTDGSASGSAIVLNMPLGAEPVPLFSWFGLVLLLAAIILLGWLAQRRMGRIAAAGVIVLIAGLAWAMNFVLDGDLSDWGGLSPAGQDPTGDATDGSAANDLLAGFAAFENGTLYFRIDAVDMQNSAPDATADGFSTDEDMTLNVAAPGVLGNDTDPDSDPLTAVLDSGPSNAASFTLNANGSFDYTPASDFNGTDSFSYRASDGQANSAAATVTLTVNAVNDAPIVQDDAATTDEDVQVDIDVLANDSDVDGNLDPATVNVSTPPANGSTAVNNSTGVITYTKAVDFNGSDSFVYEVCDDGTPMPVECATATVSVTIDPVNDPPTANDDSFNVDEDSSSNSLAVLANDDTAPDTGETLTITAVGTPDQGGSATTDGSTITYTPAPDFVGTETFTYTIGDGNGGSDSATVEVTVANTNMDAPACTADSASTDEDTPTLIDVLANDADADPGQTATLTVTAVDTAGTTGLAVNNGTDVTYDPNGQFESLGAGDQATDTFSYTAQDADGLTCMETVTVTITGVDDPAVTANDTFRTVGNTLLEVDDVRDDPQPSVFVTGSVLDNDSDPDNALSVSGTSNVTAGAVVNMAADGTFTYVPPAGLRGDGNPATADDSFDYQLSGGETATVSIDIDGLVWYVDNTSNGGTVNTGAGTSTDPFSTLSDGSGNTDPDDAEDTTIAGDVVYVFQGDGSTTNQNAGYLMNDGEHLLGEGVDLVVEIDGTPTTLFSGNPANRPAIGNGAGDGVSVLADAADRNGIEVRGLSINGSVNAVDVTSANTFAVDVIIADNFVAGLGAEGLDFNPGSSGAFFATVFNNAFTNTSAAGNAIDVTPAGAAGDVHLAIDGNVDITSSAGSGIVLDNAAGGGNLFVTSLSGNTVHGNTAGDGIRIVNATFDANPGDADFTGDQVSGGDTTVGAGNPVGGSAMVLANVSGDLAFGALSLATDGAGSVGLDATGNGVFNAGAGTGFEITNTGGTINSANGPAVDLDPLTAGLTFASVSSGSSGVHGIRLHDVAGTFTATGGTVANSVGSAVRVTGTNPGDSTVVVSLSGMTLTHTVGATPVIFGQNSSGQFSLTGSAISKGGGRLIEFDDMDGGSDFTGTTVTSTNHHGLSIIDSAGTHAFANVEIASATPAPVAGVNLQDNTGTVSFGRLDIHTNGAAAFFASNGGTVEVADATSQLTALGHRALDASDTAFAGVTFAGVTVPAANPSATGGVLLNNNTGTLSIGTVNVTTTGGTGFSATNAGTVNVTNNTSAIDATSGPGLVINPTAVDMQFASVRSVGSGTTGISITGATGTGVTIGSVDIDDTTGAGVSLTNNSAPMAINGGMIGETINTGTTTGGNALDVDQGAATVTVAAAITNTAGRSVDVSNRSGGTVTVSGAIADSGTGINVASNTAGSTVFSNASKVINTGTNGAVTLAGNPGHLVQLTGGGLDIDTTSGFGFRATGGGTVEVAGANNTVDTTTGTGVEIANTDIGAGNVTWRSVSVNGATNGILLNTTGTAGDFVVTGDGTMTGGVFNRNGSGGTIQSTTGDGVSLTNVNGATLRQMNLLSIGTGAADDAVAVSGGSAIVLSAAHIQAPAGSGWESTNIGAGNRIDHGSLVEDIATSNEAGVRVRNTSTAGSLTLDASTFRDQAQGGGTFNGNSFVEVTGIGSGFEFVLNVLNGCTFEDIFGNAINVGAGSVVGDTVTMTTNVSGSTFRNNPDPGGLGILGLGSVHSATSRFDISGNTFLNLVDLVSTDGVIDISSCASPTTTSTTPRTRASAQISSTLRTST